MYFRPSIIHIAMPDYFGFCARGCMQLLQWELCGPIVPKELVQVAGNTLRYFRITLFQTWPTGGG